MMTPWTASIKLSLIAKTHGSRAGKCTAVIGATTISAVLVPSCFATIWLVIELVGLLSKSFLCLDHSMYGYFECLTLDCSCI